MKYFEELKKSMEYLSQDPKVLFLGQAVEVPGTAMTNTLKNVSETCKLEMPVCEEMQMGMSIGMSLNGYIPVTIYPRWNFLILAINQLINHLDKIKYMYDIEAKVIIRTSIGSERPLNPQHQHVGDFSKAISLMSKNIEIITLEEPEDIFPSYQRALLRKDKKSTVLVEYGDYYNEK